MKKLNDNPVNYNDMRTNKYLFELDYKVCYEIEYIDDFDDIAYLIKRNKLEIIKKQLSEMPDFTPNQIITKNGENFLHMCASKDVPQLFEWALQTYPKCDISAVNEQGETPLMLAARDGSLNVVKIYDQ